MRFAVPHEKVGPESLDAATDFPCCLMAICVVVFLLLLPFDLCSAQAPASGEGAFWDAT